MKNNNQPNNATTSSNNQPNNNQTRTNQTRTNQTRTNSSDNNNTTRTNQTRTNLINDYSNLNANGQQISWLIFDSGKTPYKIAKATGVPDGNLYLVKKGERSIENLSLSVASKLTAYAINLQGQQGGNTNGNN